MSRNVSGNPFMSKNQQSQHGNANTVWTRDSTWSNTATHMKGNHRNKRTADNVFNHLPPSLKQHKDFFSVQNINLICNICDLQVINSNVGEHIKTKLHEDNIILLFKDKLPTHLHNILEFVSFHMSNLSCNLCRCKIEFTSANVYETILNIITHNFHENHAIRRSNNSKNTETDFTAFTLSNLAEKFPIIKDNKHLIETKVDVIFKCKSCDKNIAFGKQENVLVDNLIGHFLTSEHKGLQFSKNANNIMRHPKENMNFEDKGKMPYLQPCSSESNLNLIHNETPSFEPKRWMSTESILKPNNSQEGGHISAKQKKSHRKGFFSPLLKIFKKY